MPDKGEPNMLKIFPSYIYICSSQTLTGYPFSIHILTSSPIILIASVIIMSTIHTVAIILMNQQDMWTRFGKCVWYMYVLHTSNFAHSKVHKI